MEAVPTQRVFQLSGATAKLGELGRQTVVPSLPFLAQPTANRTEHPPLPEPKQAPFENSTQYVLLPNSEAFCTQGPKDYLAKLLHGLKASVVGILWANATLSQGGCQSRGYDRPGPHDCFSDPRVSVFMDTNVLHAFYMKQDLARAAKQFESGKRVSIRQAIEIADIALLSTTPGSKLLICVMSKRINM